MGVVEKRWKVSGVRYILKSVFTTEVIVGQKGGETQIDEDNWTD